MAGRFTIRFAEGVQEDFRRLRAYDRRIVLEAIETHLVYEPHVETRQRKLLHNLVPPFEVIPPIWQLRVGSWRVLYDVNEEDHGVVVRAVRRKPAHLKTEEIL
jgi:mRNA-degrading endonuclease RelE of RelBE toxin-antitoxin system